MPEERIVPTGPSGAVRGPPAKQVGENVDPRDNTPTEPSPKDKDKKKEEIPKYGGGGVRVRAKRAFWPAEQPDNAKLNKEARERGEPAQHRENVVREGEVADIPNEHAMDLLEQGIVERVKDHG